MHRLNTQTFTIAHRDHTKATPLIPKADNLKSKSLERREMNKKEDGQRGTKKKLQQEEGESF